MYVRLIESFRFAAQMFINIILLLLMRKLSNEIIFVCMPFMNGHRIFFITTYNSIYMLYVMYEIYV